MLFTPALDPGGSQPLYQQLYQYIKNEIMSAQLPPGAKLPSKRKLADHLKISQNTVGGAYDQLVDEGYLHPKERSGYYVQEIHHVSRIPPVPKAETESADRSHGATVDFAYHGVDLQQFPFSVLRRLARDILAAENASFLKPTDPQGYGPLRQAVASYLRHARGVHCTAEQVVVSSGTEFLFHILFQLLERDSIYGIEDPGQDRLALLFRRNRAQFVPIPLDHEGLSPSALAQAHADVVCVTPAHQFPTGTIMSVGRRSELLAWAGEQPNRYIVEDDYDGEFKYSGRPVPSLQNLDRSESVVYMGTFSKSLTPSMRISYMVLPERLLRRYRRELSYLVCPVPLLEQQLLYRFLQEGHFEKHLNRVRTLYRKKREALVKGLRSISADIRIRGAEAGLHVVVEVANGMTETQLVSAAAAHGVKLHGLSSYHIQSSPPQRPSVLVGYAPVTMEAIDRGIGLLQQAWFGD